MSLHSLYLFNPEHDMALASGETNYMAPAVARQMASDLALLPIWYADPDSFVLASSAYNLQFIQEVQTYLPLPVQLITEPELAFTEDLHIIPWGWNLALRKRLYSLGVKEEYLPNTEKIALLRINSHRSRAVRLLPKLQMNEFFCGESRWMTMPEEWQAFVESYEYSLLKAPLSGSGKGLNWCKGVFTPQIANWCARISKGQGGIIGEPLYNKLEDFAMEFYSDGTGRIQFVGYSLFQTGKSGAYEGNLLFSDTDILQRLSEYVPSTVFYNLRCRLEEELSVWLGMSYSGYLGVDMMICSFPDSPQYRIHPCVEVNLRMNMGVVARMFTDRYLAFGTRGEYRLAYHSVVGTAMTEHQRLLETFPLVIEEGKIRSGYMPLVPVTAKSAYHAFVICE